VTESDAALLAIDDEQDLLDSLRKVLGRKGFQVTTALSGPEGLALVPTVQPEVVLVDLKMPGMDGRGVLQALRKQDPNLPVILMTGFATVQTALAAVKEGAFDYLAKPFDNDQLELVLRRALEHRRLVEENQGLQERVRQKEAFSSIVGESAAVRRLLALVEKVAASDVNALIVGESGTGKELVARAIHGASAARQRHFVPVDCAALPENLLESELFGYEAGAFTGANRSKVGLFEHASQGTLFLDEVTEMPLALQSKLLRALQERSIRRLGGTEIRSVDVRILSATNRHVDNLVAEGRLREDLYYRLKVVTIEVPPLRQRDNDIALLAKHFFDELRGRTPKPLEGISSAAMMMLESYSWPGNVRELRNAIERAVTLTEATYITPLDLPSAVLAAVEDTPETETGQGHFQQDKHTVISRFERDYVDRMLRDTEGNVAEAARRAGMERPAFHRLMRGHRIDAAPYRVEPRP
jgi:DNA-binding NtrC family response regulator